MGLLMNTLFKPRSSEGNKLIDTATFLECREALEKQVEHLNKINGINPNQTHQAALALVQNVLKHWNSTLESPTNTANQVQPGI
jgi:hypothetical protein